MNEEQHLTYELGMTNVPSDATSDDNGLEESIGLTYADGEHRVIQKPTLYATISEKTLVYVHTHGGTTRYIVTGMDGNDKAVYWCLASNTSSFTKLITYTGELHVESVGNTVILSTADGLYYLLWDGRSNSPTYKVIGNSIPQISASFKLYDFSDNDITYDEKYISLEGMLHGRIAHIEDGKTVFGSIVKEGMYEDMKESLQGLVAMRLNKVKEEKRFAFPFWARCALRLYDGSYIYISQPFLLFPSVSRNWNIFTCDTAGELEDMRDAGGVPRTNYKPQYARLYYKINLPSDFRADDWKDIIGGIDIFVSEEVMTFDMQGSWTIENTYTIPAGEDYSPMTTTVNPLFNGSCILADSSRPKYNNSNIRAANLDDYTTWQTYYRPSFLSEGDITQKLLKTSNFYKLLEIDVNDLASKTSWNDSTTEILRGTLSNLVNQPRLEYDDYFSRAPMTPKVMKTYNGRLHLADITRKFFAGFTEFSFAGYDGYVGVYEYEYWVDIKTDSGIRTVKASAQKGFPEMFDLWFYYPDPRAFRLKVKYTKKSPLPGEERTYEYPLKQHPNLNGAYYFGSLPSLNASVPTNQSITMPTDPEDSPEDLRDKVFVSENNNPYLFTSKGEYHVGLGAVVGFAMQSMALGEQEHGFHPLIVFCERGFSMFRVNKSDGTYLTTDVFSREVCSSPKSITETDGPVFFASKKGLMVVVGSDAGCDVKCVSEQLSGKSDEPFAEFLQDAVIAYDYRDGLLWIFNDESDYAWIYNIKSGTFGRYEVDVEQQQVQQQAAPLLQSSPRRSAENATLAFVTLPFTGSHTMDGTENTDNNISHLDTSSPVELYYAGDTIKKFYLKGLNTGGQETYFTTGWTFEGHAESEYYNLYGAIIPGTLFLDDNGHYWVQGGANAILIDLRTTNPALWDQLPANGDHYFFGGESFVSYSDIDLSKEVYLQWGQNLPASAANRWVLRGEDLNGDTCYVLSGWTFKGHTESEYYDDLTTLEVNTGVLFVTGTQYKISTEGNIFRTLTVAEEPTPTEYITPSVESLSFAQAGETKTFDISSNVSWAISKSSGSDWLTVSPDNGSNNDTISVVAEANSNANSRTATLTIVDTNDGTISATVSISQAGTSPTPPTPTPADKITVVNNYPDYLIQLDNVVYSLIERPDINNDNSGPYAASMITRALKLGGGLTLKSIMRMKNIFDIHSGGTLSVEIWAKNNLNDAWVQLTHLRGVPHKYYQLRYTFTGLLATDRFAGTVLITQERRTNKLR